MRPNALSIGMLATVLLLSLATGCSKKEPEKPKKQEVILNVRTVDLANRPVEMVRFYINGKKFGITDQDGTFKGRYAAKDGDTLTFNVEAPSGYSVPPNVDQSRWQLKVNYPSDGRPLQVDFTATLQRPERDYLFMVRTGSPAVPVKVNDRLVGKTGPTGEALLRVPGVPGTNFNARAAAISFSGTFAEDDEVYLLTEQKTGPLGGGDAVAVTAGDGGVVDGGASPDAVAAAVVDAGAAVPDSAVAVAPEPVPVPEPAPAPEPAPKAEPKPVEVARVEPPKPTPSPFAGLGGSTSRAAKPERTPRAEVVVEPAPRPARVERTTEPRPTRVAPEPRPVAVAAKPSRPSEDDDMLALLDDPTPPVAKRAPEPAPVPPPVKAEPARKAPESKGGLLDDGDVVDQGAIDRKATVSASSGGSVATMSHQEVTDRLDRVKAELSRSQVLTASNVEFLGQVDRTHPGFGEANRLLADYYYRLKDYKRQTEALENATSVGRLKHDPQVLLSLAKAYAQQKNYRKALSSMGRVEAKMRPLSPAQKADAFRFHAEILEFEFLRQYSEDPKRANVTLVDKAIAKWEHFRTFSQGADPAGVAKADEKIKKLNELKSRVEL